MPTRIPPAASLRSAQRLPAARALFLAANNLIYMALWSIGGAIFRVAANFLPALREGRVTGRRADLHSSGVPAFLRSIVFGAGFDPAFAGWGFLALPERRFGLQPVDQEMAGGECRLAMRRGGGDEHNAVAGFEPAVAVDHQHRIERPAPMGLGLDLGKPFFGHARIMLEGQRRNRVPAPPTPH